MNSPRADVFLGVTDDAPSLRATLRQPSNPDGTPGDTWDLTGATVTLVVGFKNQSTPAVTVSVTVLDQALFPGMVEYDWAGLDTSVPGTYELRFKVTLATTKKFSSPNDRTGYLLVISDDPE